MLLFKSLIVLVSLSTWETQSFSSKETFADLEACRAATVAGAASFRERVGEGILVLGDCYEAAREGDPS